MRLTPARRKPRMVRTAKPDFTDSNAARKTAPAAAPDSQPSTAGRKPRPLKENDGQASGKYGLAKGPLGIVLAALFLVEAVMGLVARSNLPSAATVFVSCAMVVLAFAAFGGFFYAIARLHPHFNTTL